MCVKILNLFEFIKISIIGFQLMGNDKNFTRYYLEVYILQVKIGLIIFNFILKIIYVNIVYIHASFITIR